MTSFSFLHRSISEKSLVQNLRFSVTWSGGALVMSGRNKTGTSQVGAISKAQKYSMNNYWKHLEKKLSKVFLEKNFKKSNFF